MWTPEQVAEYFEVVDEDYASLSFYDKICTWAQLGEDDYPHVVDLKGQLTG